MHVQKVFNLWEGGAAPVGTQVMEHGVALLDNYLGRRSLHIQVACMSPIRVPRVHHPEPAKEFKMLRA